MEPAKKDPGIGPMRNRSEMRSLLLAVTALVTIAISASYFAGIFRVDENIHNQLSTLNRGLVGEPESLDHHNFSSDQAAEVLRDTGEGLISIASNGDLQPGVAESWTVSDDGLSYQFKIRENCTWSNGSQLTAHDFVGTYRKLVDPSRGAINANAIVSVRNANKIIEGKADVGTLGVLAVDDKTLLIQLENPTPYFLQLLTHPSLFPVFLPSRAGSSSSPTTEITNGAYTIEDWTRGSEISLKKNPKYWDAEKVFFENVRYHIVEEGTEFNRFRAGELDITGTVDSSAFTIAKRDFSEELKVAPKLGIYYYGYNLSNPLFADNVNLRRALSLAIDRSVLVSKITGRGEEPAYSWVPPGTYNYRPQVVSELSLGKQERERRAQEYFAAAGYGPKNTLAFQLRYNKSDVQERTALAISAMWRDILGVQVELVSEEFQVLLSNIRDREVTDVFRLSWTGNYNDPQTFLELFESNHPQNLTGYSNREFDEIILASRTEVDSAKRRLMLEVAERIALDDYPVIPIYFYVSKHLVRKEIKGWTPNVLDIHLSQHLSAGH